jgi:hypothetical protein
MTKTYLDSGLPPTMHTLPGKSQAAYTLPAPWPVRSAWLTRCDRSGARLVSVHRLRQRHLASLDAEGSGSPWCFSAARPKKTPTSLPATSAFSHRQEGTARLPHVHLLIAGRALIGPMAAPSSCCNRPEVGTADVMGDPFQRTSMPTGHTLSQLCDN